MKKLLISCLLLAVAFAAHGQNVHKLKAYQFAYKTPDAYGGWSEWSDWEDIDGILVVFNFDKDKIDIYSEQHQEFDIYHYDSEDRGDGDRMVTLKSVDQDGRKCILRLLLSNKNMWQLYVDYTNIMYAYHLDD